MRGEPKFNLAEVLAVAATIGLAFAWALYVLYALTNGL